MITLIGSDDQRVTLDRIDDTVLSAVSDGDFPTVIRATWEAGEIATMIVKLNVPLQQVLMDGWKQENESAEQKL